MSAKSPPYVPADKAASGTDTNPPHGLALPDEAWAPPVPDDLGSGDHNRGGGARDFMLTALVWLGLGVAGGAAIYVMVTVQSRAGLILSGMAAMGIAVVIALGVIGPRALSAMGALLRHGSARATGSQTLAGRESLTAHGLAEHIIEHDENPVLVTKRDGVVIYANRAYMAIARAAGFDGLLPPRIDRLFSQKGAEAGKIFQLYKAAKSGQPLRETLRQTFPGESGEVLRRFTVEVTFLAEADAYVIWRLTPLPGEEDLQDPLADAYADFPRAVFGLDASGAIIWTNAALRAQIDIERGGLRQLDDLILGEADPVCTNAQRADGKPIKAMIRTGKGDPREASFVAFHPDREHADYVCVALTIEEEEDGADITSVSGDLSEAPFGVAIIEGEFGQGSKIVELNSAFSKAFEGAKRGASLQKLLGTEVLENLAKALKRKSSSGTANAVDATLGPGPDAPTHALYARAIKRKRGEYGPRRAILYSVDVTDRKRMEDDYAQDQKLKAIGKITGQVAHDFNNLLQVITSSSEDLMRRHPAGDPAYEDLVMIRQNALRAADLTKQLLAYSRKQTLTNKVLSVTDLLLDFSRFLDRTVGERVKVKLINGRGLPIVKIDRTQFETAIMNLAINARDAMAPKGGTLTIETRLMPAADIERAGVPGLDAVDYLVVDVSDTGPGIPPDIAKKIFDPFFTTKAEGKGTGLGLSTVHGIIGQMGGEITVSNGEKGGALFRIYLPAFTGTIEAEEDKEREPVPTLSGAPSEKRILVVDDEEYVRLVVVNTLKKAGYKIDFADDGVEGLEILEGGTNYDLIVTDVMMPEIDGPTMITRAREEFGSRAAVIFISGYAENAIRDQLENVDSAFFLQKPFSNTDLTDRVRRALYERERADAA